MTDIVWRVVVARDIDDDDRDALARVGASYVSGHSTPGFVSSSLFVRAPDEEAARRAIETALGEHAFIREARAMPVFVYAPITPDARSAFESAAGDDARVGGIVEEESTGKLEVYFELPPASVDRVFDEARGVYASVMRSAGLDVPEPLEMTMSGFEALLVEASRDRQLLGRARELLASGENELAVVVAQTACELVVADALRSLLVAHVSDELRPWAVARVKAFTLIDDATRELWARVVGSRIQDEAFWAGYRQHVARRNDVVHAGGRVEPGAAEASLTVAESLFDYVEQAVAGARRPGVA